MVAMPRRFPVLAQVLVGELNCYHPYKVALYLVLNAVDWLLTWRLLMVSGGDIVESNPIAGACLYAYGWIGLAVFKAAVVLLVCGVAVFVSLYRPRTSGRLLSFGCLIVALVIVYSGFLWIFGVPPNG
jgi:hypothetical protein